MSNDLQSLGQSSQKNADELKITVGEIKGKMAKEHSFVVKGMSKTINELEKTVNDQQEIIENIEKKNHRQSCILARLNHERDETTRELKAKDQLIIEGDRRILKLQEETRDTGSKIQKLQEDVSAHKVRVYGNGARSMVEMITEPWQESKKQRTQP